jgi:hypothetical protein
MTASVMITAYINADDFYTHYNATRIHAWQKWGFYWFGPGEQPGHSFYVFILRLGKASVAAEFLFYVLAVFSHPSGVSTSPHLLEIGVRGGFVVG